VNSNTSKPGPKPAIERNLLIWEREWYWVFDGLVRGIPATDGIEQDWEPIRPPKLSGIPELDEERLATWNAKHFTSEAWVPRRYRRQTRGRPAERDIWIKLLRAKTSAQVRAAYRASRFWLNPSKNTRGWVEELDKHPQDFLKAKTYRYPKSKRPSSEEKRVLHFARAMSGTMTEIGPVRAIDVIRTLKHDNECGCTKCHVDRWNSFEKAATKALALEGKRFQDDAKPSKQTD
jgi:hypothetical protein